MQSFVDARVVVDAKLCGCKEWSVWLGEGLERYLGGCEAQEIRIYLWASPLTEQIGHRVEGKRSLAPHWHVHLYTIALGVLMGVC